MSKPKKISPKMRAKKQGIRARQNGRFQADNPYDKSTQYDLYQAWTLGYTDEMRRQQDKKAKANRGKDRLSWI